MKKKKPMGEQEQGEGLISANAPNLPKTACLTVLQFSSLYKVLFQLNQITYGSNWQSLFCNNRNTFGRCKAKCSQLCGNQTV